MSTSPSIDPLIPEPMTGFVGDIGGGHGGKSIFKANDIAFGSDFFLGLLARGSAIVVLMMLVALVTVLAYHAWPSIRESGFRFVTSSKWSPEHQTTKRDANGDLVRIKNEDGEWETVQETVPGVFGGLAFIYGTGVSSALALLFAVPLSLGAALFLVRIGPWLTPTLVKSGIFSLALITLLAGVGRINAPSIAAHSGLIITLGLIIGVGCSGVLFYLVKTKEDPRVGPQPALQMFLHTGIPVVVFFLLRLAGLGSIWSLLWAIFSATWVGSLGRAGVGVLSFLIEFLAAIPSIAYGLWGLFVMVPFLQKNVEIPLNSVFSSKFLPFLHFLHTDQTPQGRDMFAAGVILAIMIIPIITAISRDVLRAVPQIQIEGTQALGATWWQSSWAMLRYGRSGLFGAIMLGLARAAGETMAVAMVIGNSNGIHLSLFEPAYTMSSLLANEFKETSPGLQEAALIELGLVLLIMSLAFNIIARYLVVGKQARAA